MPLLATLSIKILATSEIVLNPRYDKCSIVFVFPEYSHPVNTYHFVFIIFKHPPDLVLFLKSLDQTLPQLQYRQ